MAGRLKGKVAVITAAGQASTRGDLNARAGRLAADELARNPRAESAVLRAVEKLAS